MLFNGLYCTGNSTGVFSRDALYEDGEVYAFGTDFRHLGVRKYAAANPDGGWNAANAVYEIFIPFAREDQKRHVTSNVHGEPRALLLRASDSAVLLEGAARVPTL